MTRFARARQVGDAVVETALDAIADTVRRRAAGRRPRPRLQRRRTSNARRSSTRSSICRSTAPSPGVRSTRRRSIGRSRSGRATRRSPRSSAPDGQRVEFQVLGEAQVVSHVMSRYETPWALNVRRVHVLWWAPALPPCGYAAFDLRGIEMHGGSCRRARSCSRAHARPTRRRTDAVLSPPASASPRTSGCGCLVNDDGTFEVTDKATRRDVSPRRRRSRTSAMSATNTTTARRRRTGASTSADARVTGVHAVSAGPLRAAFRVELELPLPIGAERRPRRRASETVAVPVSIDATLDAGSPRVAFAVSVDNRASDHRLRILFPSGASHVDDARAPTPRSTSSRGRRGCRCRRRSGTNRRSAARR